MNIFVTGTDTGVGKTVVSSWLCMHSRKSYWKPIQTGDDSDTDVIRVFSPQTPIVPEAYRLKQPLSPYDAANFENRKIDTHAFHAVENTIIEGAGGALVPITEKFYMADLMKITESHAIIVAKSKLGFLNHICLTVEALRHRDIPIIGIILNGEVESFLIQTIEKFSEVKVLAIIPYSKNLKQALQDIPLPVEVSQ